MLHNKTHTLDGIAYETRFVLCWFVRADGFVIQTTKLNKVCCICTLTPDEASRVDQGKITSCFCMMPCCRDVYFCSECVHFLIAQNMFEKGCFVSGCPYPKKNEYYVSKFQDVWPILLTLFYMLGSDALQRPLFENKDTNNFELGEEHYNFLVLYIKYVLHVALNENFSLLAKRIVGTVIYMINKGTAHMDSTKTSISGIAGSQRYCGYFNNNTMYDTTYGDFIAR